MARALVTGATGLVGSHIVERLVTDGWTVRGLVRSLSKALESLGAEPVQGDVLDRDAFVRAAKGTDVVFHTAAAITPSGGWESYRRLNIDGTENAIAAAESAGARLLQLSSVAVYGPEGRFRGVGLETDEDTPRPPARDGVLRALEARSEQMVMDAIARKNLGDRGTPDVITGAATASSYRASLGCSAPASRRSSAVGRRPSDRARRERRRRRGARGDARRCRRARVQSRE